MLVSMAYNWTVENQNILLTAIGGMATAIVFLFGMIREQTRRCESERRELLSYIIEIAKLLPPELRKNTLHIPGMAEHDKGNE
jgi:hypothetical protein